MIADTSRGRSRITAAQEEAAVVAILRIAALLVVVAMLAVFVFLAGEGTKIFTVDGVSLGQFLGSTNFDPEGGHAGALAFIAGSLGVTLFALLVGGSLGIVLGVFLAEIAPPRIAAFFRPTIELLIGIPSVAYGWLALTTLVPFIRIATGTTGFGILSAGIVLSVMILPTVTALTEDALATVPRTLIEGAASLGATQWETLRRVVLPAARSGIAVALILGTARAIGETLAVEMVIGNAGNVPHDFLHAAATLSTEIVIDMGGASQGSLLQHALFAMAFVLLLISMLLIGAVRATAGRRRL